MSRLLKLITFDATETLMMFQPRVAQKYSESAKKFGISISGEDVISHFKVQYKMLSKNHPNFGRSTGLGWKSWWTQLVMSTFQSAKPSTDHETLEKLALFLIEEYQTNRCWALADGATDILDMLKRKNIFIGVISNYDERLENTLNSLNISKYFDFILTSYSAGVMKPDKKIFDLARSQIKNNLSHSVCAHVGNSLQYDYLGSKNAGWNPIYVGPINKDVLIATAPNTRFNSLTELYVYFEKVL